MGQFGKRQVRAEDDRLITGRGCYIDDITLPNMAHIVVVRSQAAHARITVDTSDARALDGVIAVFTAEDLPEAARILPDCHPNPALTNPRGPSVLANGLVRYVGEPIAAIVAENRYIAEDAAELVQVDYETEAAVIDLEKALTKQSARVHEDLPSNLAALINIATGNADSAFAKAHCVVKERLEIQRGAGQAMETRGVVAHWNRFEDRMVVWNVSQVPYVHRTAIANALGLPERQVQVQNPDVGGGFGYKGLTYTEDILVPVVARQLDRPVKWIEDRREHLIASYHERTQIHELEMATTEDGTILGIRGRFYHDTGAYTPWGPVVPLLTAVNIPGPYRVPNYAVQCDIVYTNTTPVAPVRGAGRPQACYVTERLLDRVGKELGIDPAALRKRNLITAEEYPYDVGFISRDGTRRTYDSGNVPALLDRALEILDYDNTLADCAKLRTEGRYRGIGIACCVEDTGLGPFEEVGMSIEADGSVTVRMGTPSQGQGQKTSFAQVAADILGVPFDKVKVLTGNTDLVRYSIGTFASRAGVVTGSAVSIAANQLKERACAIGAVLLQTSPEELDLKDGKVVLKADETRSIDLAQIVHTSLGESGNPLPLPDFGPGMSTTASFSPPTNTFATGCHAALVEVDPATCKVEILRYIAVEDFGNLINPLIVDGQVIGGVSLGVGNTFFEKAVYDSEGQILTGTFMDYLVATSMDVPRVEIDHLSTPSPLNPLGMKGAGQGGTIPVPAVISSAVENALEPFGVHLCAVPFSESDLFQNLRNDDSKSTRKSA
ncbi:xanthine dehydrogenase family protein molybdopterin-binding subunit [Marivibrio halodurans]|uniref:Xanthine dehydrogenase family protein molybdopterin-binding subunit n=1 Tax=Marivibrio halodurans TaxID=2039722 RepID=A0A8J7V0J0_9PROT|nr:xanthine dehydrogenase family protein molybdopterin-binding subunit [Marivibrio halodurans]MBP5856846.1 xanthine dehydrogenase family protein molybdopterin-binding subunit [Marivibrio halodurans]